MGNDKLKEFRFICDSGAQMNLITETAFSELSLCRQRNRINVIGINNQSTNTVGKVDLELWHRMQDRRLAMATFVIVQGFTLNHPQHSFSHVPFARPDLVNLADPSYNEPGSIDGILGVDILSRHITDGLRRNRIGLIAQATNFGWIVFGSSSANESSGSDMTAVSMLTIHDVHAQVRRLWEIDECDDLREPSAEDQECEQLYQSNVTRSPDRYSVHLLLRPNVQLGESYAMARRRLACLEARFRRSPELKQSYVAFMDDYEGLGHMRLADPLTPLTQHYYIPHHAVAIERKFRVVFDGSAKTTNGKSLNDALYVGPRLQCDLFVLQMRFRTGEFALTADVSKMFRQIAVHPEFWDYTRILWRRNSSEPVREYWLTVVTYGLASSPYNAVKTLIQCAIDNADRYPRAAKIVQQDFYVDDLLTSVESINDAIDVKKEVIELLQKGGFTMAKWRSNCSAILDEPVGGKIVGEPDSTSILGVIWNHRNDELQFKVQDRPQPDVITKRIITSEAARIFDPQGYLAPITVRAKLFIQDLWRTNKDWDDPLPAEVQTEWRLFYGELRSIDRIRIPRWLGTKSTELRQIHVFCDASSRAYGAVAYVRVSSNGQWSARLLCAKTKVAPTKNVTIPRLELLAIELGCKLLPHIRQVPTLAQAPVFVWTDSEVALYWIRKPSNELKVFVSNRVNRIIRAISINQTRHVRSEQNPADLLSRGVIAETLEDNALWWNGPKMLQEDNDDWPVWKAAPPVQELDLQIVSEIKHPYVVPTPVVSTPVCIYLSIRTKEGKEQDLMSKISNYRKVCRITVHVIRFCSRAYEAMRRRGRQDLELFRIYSIDKWKSDATISVSVQTDNDPKELSLPRLSLIEFNNALNYWIKMSQRESFPDEWKLVRKEKPVARKSQLWMLTPQLDSSDVMRVHGRLKKASLSLDEKHPIILHRSSILAHRLAEEAHQRLCHGGAQMCTQYLRQRYWIIGGRILLRKIVSKCVTCTRYRSEACQQFMADLPAVRVTPGHVFECTGVDYAGPITIRVSRNVTSKGYIAVFVCMKYKAVHLELVGSLDADAFLAALSRFASTRGRVRHLYSDNGGNFVKADRMLREAIEWWKDGAVMEHMETHSIQWHFNVPLAPHHGGLWESMVKTTKSHLKRMGGAHIFTYEELDTLLKRIAACINSRPLTPLSNDPTDLTALTPGHFMTGRPIITPYESQIADVPMNRLTAWQRISKLHQQFWARWSQEYLLDQQRRVKCAGFRRSLQVGDLVLIRNELAPPSQWFMGRVVEVFEGRDNRVRSCVVRTAKSSYTRPVTQLVLLPIDGKKNESSEAGFP